jgi:hypothetical protein
MRISQKLSEQVFSIATREDLAQWVRDVEQELAGVTWRPLGDIENNIHTVEVASDPALALVERPTNSIDALLDLRARERGEKAATPHAAARAWWGVPAEGLSAMSDADRRMLADHVRVTMLESGVDDRPTIVIEDSGTGQHPDDFPKTHLSLLGSNKKSSTHVMGVYNAGGAASYKFAKGNALLISRLAPSLLGDREDEIGVTVVRYDPLDPDRYKSGMYVYMVAKDHTILRLGIPKLPDLDHGTHVKLVEYELPRYARGAHEPKSSLWHLFHAALPDPALPFRVIETRKARFKGMKGPAERRVVSGLIHLLGNPGTADYSDTRTITLGPEIGSITLRYFVLNEGREPDNYTTAEQGLTIMLNGQRQIAKDRAWLKRHTELYFLYKRLLVFVDGTALTSAARRDVFASTRETGVDSPLAKKLLDAVMQELDQDEELAVLDEQAKQRALASATKTTTERVKKQLVTQIGAFLRGVGGVRDKGPRELKRVKRRRPKPSPRPPRPIDDSAMLEVPDLVRIVQKPLHIEQGSTAALWLEINAKNDFFPKYSESLSVVVGAEMKDHVRVVSQGRLLGGRMRAVISASRESPIGTSSLKVALVVPSLGVLLTDEGTIEVEAPEEDSGKPDGKKEGEPQIEITWIRRDKWGEFSPAWDEETAGECQIYRDDPKDETAITRVVWVLNESFVPYEKVVAEKKLSEEAMKTFRERYEFPIAFGLFRQRMAEESEEKQADEAGKSQEIPAQYTRGERSRLARAVLLAIDPDINLAQSAST